MIIKRGDAQPIIVLEKPMLEDDDEKAKRALEAAKQRAKNINKAGNKNESTVESIN